MLEFKAKTKVQKGSAKSFGIVFGFLFLFIFIYIFFEYGNFNIYILIVSIIFFIFTFLYSKIFYFPNLIWLKFGLILGKLLSPLIMLIIYLVLFMPIGLFFLIFKKDLLEIKINKSVKSYWKTRKYKMQSMNNQY